MVNDLTKATLHSIDFCESAGEWVISLDLSNAPEAWLHFHLLNTGELTELTLRRRSSLLISFSKSAQKTNVSFYRYNPNHEKISLPGSQIEYLLSFLLEANFKQTISTHFHFTGREEGSEKDLTITYYGDAVETKKKSNSEIPVTLFSQDSRLLIEIPQHQYTPLIYAISTSLSWPKNIINLVDKNSGETLAISSSGTKSADVISVSNELLRKAKNEILSMIVSKDFWSSPLVILGEKSNKTIEIEVITETNPSEHSNNSRE